MKKEQAELRAQKKAVAKELRNASKRASRLKKRARVLTDDDLLEVLRMRKSSELDAEAPAVDAAALAEPNAGVKQ